MPKVYTTAQAKARDKFVAKRSAKARIGKFNEIVDCIKAENSGRFWIRLINDSRPAADEGNGPTYGSMKSAGRALAESDKFSESNELLRDYYLSLPDPEEDK